MALIVVGTLIFDWWAPSISFDGHRVFLWIPGIFLGTWHFLLEAPGILVPTQQLNGHPPFLLVCTWHFVCWALIASSCGHVEFWWPPSILMGTQHYFWQAPDIVVGCWLLLSHAAFLLLAMCPGFGQDRVNFHRTPGRGTAGGWG